jgi:hypothetical protein
MTVANAIDLKDPLEHRGALMAREGARTAQRRRHAGVTRASSGRDQLG